MEIGNDGSVGNVHDGDSVVGLSVLERQVDKEAEGSDQPKRNLRSRGEAAPVRLGSDNTVQPGTEAWRLSRGPQSSHMARGSLHGGTLGRTPGVQVIEGRSNCRHCQSIADSGTAGREPTSRHRLHVPTGDAGDN